MGRRRKQPSLGEILIDAPWWVSAVLSVGAYVVVSGILPGLLASNRFLIGVAQLVRTGAWIPTVAFGFLAVLSFVRERQKGNANSSEGSDTVADLRQRRRASPSGLKQQTMRSASAMDQPAQRRQDPSPSAVRVAPIESWTLDALKQLEWKRFELLCVWYYEAMGFTVKTVPHGPDGGIDATLYKQGLETPVAIVQCKAWNKPVKVEQVRALAGVMHEHKVKRGVFWSLSGYVGRPVQNFAERAGIQLLDGAAILERIRALDQYKQATLLAQAFKGDYRTPTCVACGVKLVERAGKGGPFWGCRNYPRCKVTLARAA